MKKTRVILALLLALLVLGGMFMAAADEGQGSMDVSPGEGGDEPPVVTDPTEPPIDPTDPPIIDPTDPPGPTDAPTDDPGPTDAPTDAPTDEPTMEPTDEPTAEPSEEPTPEPPPPDNGSNGGDTNQGSATSPSVNMGGSIRQPSTGFRRPVSSSPIESSGSSQSSSSAPIDDGPQYVTFARVTQKSNAMSRTLFYSGAACVGTGVIGLIVLMVFVIRGRGVDEREEIFAEIEQAAVRQPVRPRPPQQQPRAEAYDDDPYAQYDRQQDYGYDSPAPSLHRPEPEELAVPVNGSVYTEEFELPPQQIDYREYQNPEPMAPPKASVYTEEFEPPRQVPPSGGPIMPTETSMYTDEFSLPVAQPPQYPAQHYAEQEYAAQPPVQRRPVRQAPAPAPRPAPQPRQSSQVPPEQMDTTELLPEILYGDENK